MEGVRDALSKDLSVTKATLQTQLIKEADMINEMDRLVTQVSDLSKVAPSTASSRASDVRRGGSV